MGKYKIPQGYVEWVLAKKRKRDEEFTYETPTIAEFVRKAGYGGEFTQEYAPISEVVQEAVLLYGDKLIELERRIEALEQSDKVEVDDENKGT